MNEAMATNGSSALALNAKDTEALGREVSAAELRAMALTVSDDMSYQAAGDLARKIKAMQKTVKDYWEPVRAAAKKAYDGVLGKKKEMLEPLEKAEAILKRKMGDYAMEQQRRAREEEARRRREAEAAAQSKLEEAIVAEADGDAAAAEYAMAEAEVYDNYAATIEGTAKKPKATGVSMAKAWKITAVDPGKVPCTIHGVEIRPVDQKAVMRLIRASKGTIIIPGIRYEEDVSVSVRA